MGFFDKIRSGLQKTKENISETLDSVLSVFRKVDEETLEELEDALILLPSVRCCRFHRGSDRRRDHRRAAGAGQAPEH